MRFARIAVGLLLALVGLLVAVLAGVAAFWLVGPDNTVDTGEQPLSSAGLAVMTAPDLIDRHGPTLHVTATGAEPVFVGVGQDIDVASYLGGSQYTRIVSYDLPSRIDTQEMKGRPAALTAPGELDWWTLKAAGEGRQSITWPIADGRYDVVVMNADGSPRVDAKVTFGVEVDGLFGTCLMVFGGGLVLLVAGLVLMFAGRRPAPRIPLPITVPVVAPAMPYTPPAPKQPSQVRRTGALAIVLLLGATGCAAVPVRNVSQQVTTKPATTVADGQAVIDKYTEIRGRVSRTNDAELARTIEAGPRLEQTRAGSYIGRKLGTVEDKSGSDSYTDVEIGAPEFPAYPMRFVSTAKLSKDPARGQLGVWERQNAGSPWLLTHAVFPRLEENVPPMEGLRTPTRTDMAKLPLLPQTMSGNLAKYLSEGPASKQAAQFMGSADVTQFLARRAKDAREQPKKEYISAVNDLFRPTGQPTTFIAANGEALVFVNLTERFLQFVEPGNYANWTGGAVSAYSKNVKYYQTLHQDYLHEVALVIPPTGKIRILAIRTQVVGGGGS
ncbi:hypothetical protein [Kribbella sp. CA-293567]|uniref:hypothetical protein n=1 Tax=Kribbella sp. CA-293567 TaxID=3002436 RepID=UPI0022DCFD8C|nr:hypothetical protein [Kribbella sp. CA-293567]WBQ05764.1 hypothetical protein OX958_02920 [Kribbella sp. CA-293567]